MDAQRSLAAIVFTDVVGYSALMAADEARAVELFQRDLATMREICARNDGQVLKTMGDGVLMVFGSAVQAVSSALEMQAAFTAPGQLKKDILVHRIGIHVGDVLLSESDAHGDGVNVAARLHEAAPPGGIWVSSTVYDIVKGRLPVTGVSRGNHDFKNIPVPVMVFELSQGAGAVRPVAKRPSRSSNYFVTVALLLLAISIVVAGGLIYSASLHPREKVTEILDPKSSDQGGSKTGSADPGPGHSQIDAKVQSTSPQTQSKVAEIPKSPESPPDDRQPLGDTGTEKTVAPDASKPQNPPTQPTDRSGQLVQSPPPPTTPPTHLESPPVGDDQSDVEPEGSAGTTAAKTIDPAVAKTHYFFKKYAAYLRTLPDAGTPSSKQAVNRWRQMAMLKDQAVEYLGAHSKAAPITIHMGGPSGVADYGVTVTPPESKLLQARVGIQIPAGQTITIAFGQLTPAQVDALFQTAVQGLLQDPASAGMKSVLQRRLNFFEDEYALPRAQF